MDVPLPTSTGTEVRKTRVIRIPRRAFLREYGRVAVEFLDSPTHDLVVRTKHRFACAGVAMPPDLELQNWPVSKEERT